MTMSCGGEAELCSTGIISSVLFVCLHFWLVIIHCTTKQYKSHIRKKKLIWAILKIKSKFQDLS